MDTRSTAAETQHSYLSNSPTTPSWAAAAASAAISSNVSIPTLNSAVKTSGAIAIPAGRHSSQLASSLSTSANLDRSLEISTPPSSTVASTAQFATLLPYWVPQHNVYYAQLLHYNKLVSPYRAAGLQAPALSPVVSSSNAQAGPRSRSSSKVSLKDGSAGKGFAAGGHGSRSHNNPDKNRSVIASKDAKMSAKQAQSQSSQTQSSDPHKAHFQRQTPGSASSSHPDSQPLHSASVPTTPHQRARQFSFAGSREPSPDQNRSGHSPRSTYSETNNSLPALRPSPKQACKYEGNSMQMKRRIPYSVGDEKLETIPLANIKGRLEEDEEKKLATDMRDIFERLVPSEGVEEKRKRLVQKLETIFNEEWPGHEIRAHLFGSSGNLLCSDDADVDICITTDWKELEHICMIANLLARRGMEKIVCISTAKVPIVKIWDPELGLACDLNVNNTLALENTRMIRVYVETDPRVRQLAMVIKYWTRRRRINDAGIGGTFTSYTWICLIIAFLQLRTPPVLPVLHQLPYKLQKPDGSQADFADNLKRLKGFGKSNHSSEADLLFQFFRFYAHEFDYDKYALSVRLGKLILKSDKKWHHGSNNHLCVEEPFNTARNLGNTADEYSFRGVHLELRRAFDLIAEAKLEEACELYVFPKEEEKKDLPRPRLQSRPVLLRSASQSNTGSSRGGRGGHRGGRHNNYHRNGNPNRRTSTSVPTYDPNMFTPTVNMQQEMWYQNSQLAQYTPEMLQQLAYQQENMRQFQQQLYGQSPTFSQHQIMALPMMATHSNSSQTQSSDRSRTNSIDNPPLSAPLRPDLYALYGMSLNCQYFPQSANGYGTYPSSPATPSSTQDYRRPLQRSTADRGAAASSSSLRSQSQPAARSQSVAQPNMTRQSQLSSSLSSSSMLGLAPMSGNSMPIPSYAAHEDEDVTPKAKPISPHEEERYMGYFSDSLPTQNGAHPGQGQQSQLTTNGTVGADGANQNVAPSYSSGYSSEGRRPSIDQLSQSLLDCRIRKASRSPSPLGHARAFSTNTTTNPLSTALNVNKDKSRPLVVNGSGFVANNGTLQRKSYGTTETQAQASKSKADVAFSNPLQIYPPHLGYYATAAPPQVSSQNSTMSPTSRPPIVINAPHANHMQAQMDESSAKDSFRDRIAMMSSQYMNGQLLPQESGMTDSSRSAPTARVSGTRQSQNSGIGPLDLASTDDRSRRSLGSDPSLLSPVYENRTPSPTVMRKAEVSEKSDKASKSNGVGPTSVWSGVSKQVSRTNDLSQATQDVQKTVTGPKIPGMTRTGSSRENGHIRSARSESDSGWQKAGKTKKKTNHGYHGHGEQPPRNVLERKGG